MKEAQELSEATEQYYAQPLEVIYFIRNANSLCFDNIVGD